MTTLDHGMKSIMRAIRNIRNEDESKQEAICFVTGEKESGTQQEGYDQISMGMNKASNEDFYKYTRLKNMKSKTSMPS